MKIYIFFVTYNRKIEMVKATHKHPPNGLWIWWEWFKQPVGRLVFYFGLPMSKHQRECVLSTLVHTSRALVHESSRTIICVMSLGLSYNDNSLKLVYSYRVLHPAIPPLNHLSLLPTGGDRGRNKKAFHYNKAQIGPLGAHGWLLHLTSS